MSVPVGKRTVSKLEFFHLAYKMNRDITLLLVRDFGVKSISRDLKTFTHAAKMSEEDREKFVELSSKYHIDVEADYPSWLIQHYREWILELLRSLISNITKANTIYPSPPDYDYWHNRRREYQKLAQADCYQILQTLQSICYILPVKKEKLMPYVEMADNEITALKNWQKTSNRQRNNYYKSIKGK